MKRVIALFIITALCALLAACGESAAPSPTVGATQAAEKSTEKATEEPTQAPTEKPTEKPTEAPKEAPTERPCTVIVKASEKTVPVEGGVFTYTNSKYGYSVDIPAVWNEYGYIAEDEETGNVVFAHEYSRFTDNHLSGEIFELFVLPVDQEQRGNWGDTAVASSDTYKVCWDKPSDVQFEMDYYDEYRALSDTRQAVLDSVRW